MLSKILFVLGANAIIIGLANAQCNLSGEWGSSCQDPQLIDTDDAMKNAILDAHNSLRSDVALGKIKNYKPAANMATLEWDDNLAANAALNVHQCEMEHDDCTNTDQFKYAGQNLAMSMTTEDAETSPQQIADLAKSQWFGEQKNGGYYGWMNMINKFTDGGEGDHVVGHFTQYIWGSANRVGCAVSTSKMNEDGYDWNVTWLACDYSYGNMEGDPVYTSGTATSKCKTGKNSKYPGLCSTNEVYNN